jgi:hypothetical protein
MDGKSHASVGQRRFIAHRAVIGLQYAEAKIVSVNCGQSIDGLESAGSTLSTRLRKPQRT